MKNKGRRGKPKGKRDNGADVSPLKRQKVGSPEEENANSEVPAGARRSRRTTQLTERAKQM
jgi:hypothetical protein